MTQRMLALGAAFLLTLTASAEDAPMPVRAEGAPGLVICHAGSLSAGLKAVEELYTRRTGIPVTDLAGGSISLARRLASGRIHGDLYAGADAEVIDRMMKPAGMAEFTLRIASGAMVLAYTTSSKGAAAIAAPGVPFDPPRSVPAAAEDWYRQLAQAGVRINGAHPFLDPGGYRADLIFQLAQDQYGVPNLYDDLLSNLTVAHVPGGLGKAFDYQVIYEHSAAALAKADATGTYRFVRLPDEVNLGSPAQEARYARRSVAMPDLLASPGRTVAIPGTRVTWGITLLKGAAHRENAEAFLALLCSPEGADLLDAAGPAAIRPPSVAKEDLPHLPEQLKARVGVR
jgi:ABC-type molybdate transport system substrate-binding protein